MFLHLIMNKNTQRRDMVAFMLKVSLVLEEP